MHESINQRRIDPPIVANRESRTRRRADKNSHRAIVRDRVALAPRVDHREASSRRIVIGAVTLTVTARAVCIHAHPSSSRVHGLSSSFAREANDSGVCTRAFDASIARERRSRRRRRRRDLTNRRVVVVSCASTLTKPYHIDRATHRRARRQFATPSVVVVGRDGGRDGRGERANRRDARR